jgi:hypothetical protein
MSYNTVELSIIDHKNHTDWFGWVGSDYKLGEIRNTSVNTCSTHRENTVNV